MQVLLESHTELHIIVAWQGKFHMRGRGGLYDHMNHMIQAINMLRCRSRLEVIAFAIPFAILGVL
jgi:hypothetical protein